MNRWRRSACARTAVASC